MTCPVNPDSEALVENGRNKVAVTCLHCPSKILNPAVGSYVQKEFMLPHMTRQKNQTVDETDAIQESWRVSDMFHFENIGFSHTVDGVKYLICADCEMGPVGWHDLSTKESFIALSRVRNM